MFSAIPAITTLSITSPTAQASTMDQVTQGLRTNNAEQLEARSVSAPKETAENQRVNRKNEEEDRPKRQAKEKTSFQLQKESSRLSTVLEPEAMPTEVRPRLSLDVMA